MSGLETSLYCCSLPASPGSRIFERKRLHVFRYSEYQGGRFGALLPHFIHRNISSPRFPELLFLRPCAQAFRLVSDVDLRTCRTVIVAVALEQVDRTPDAESGSKSDDKSLQYTDC